MTLNLAVGLHDPDGRATYTKALAAQYISVRQRTNRPLHYFIIRDETVRSDELAKLAALINRDDKADIIDVQSHPVADRLARRFSGHYSPAVMWRIYFTEILPVDRVLSVDADLFALCDIAPLYEIDLQGKALSAPLRGLAWDAAYLRTIDVRAEDYFRMGFSLMDLARMRSHERFQNEREIFVNDRLQAINALQCLNEQTVFNYFFSRENLPMQCCLAPVERHLDALENDPSSPWHQDFRNMKNVVLDMKGWLTTSAYSFYYWSALLHTPWHEDAKAAFANWSIPRRPGGRSAPTGPVRGGD